MDSVWIGFELNNYMQFTNFLQGFPNLALIILAALIVRFAEIF